MTSRLPATILDTIPIALIIMDKDHLISFSNSHAEDIFGYKEAELLGQRMEFIIPEFYRVKHTDDTFSIELYGQCKNKKLVPVELCLNTFKEEGKHELLIVVRDISEKKRIEKEMVALNQRIMTTARKAGIAEISNSVLHNMGNVLNSINVSMNLLHIQTNHSEFLDGLRRINNLIQEHTASLSDFLIHDKRGKLIPEYLTRLAELSANEYSEMLTEIQNIHKHVQFAINIIAKQQEISGPSVVFEQCSVTELIELALNLSFNTEETKQIKIKKEYKPIPLISSDKSKLVQIFHTLITHAKMSLDHKTLTQKQIIIGVKQHDAAIEVRLQDNGAGLSEQQVSHLFSFALDVPNEFGFELHNCALLIQELNGTINVFSDGLGSGSTVTVSFPVTCLK